jgi:hypothetical protein
MHGSDKPCGKEEDIMDCKEPAGTNGITAQRQTTCVKAK